MPVLLWFNYMCMCHVLQYFASQIVCINEDDHYLPIRMLYCVAHVMLSCALLCPAMLFYTMMCLVMQCYALVYYTTPTCAKLYYAYNALQDSIL